MKSSIAKHTLFIKETAKALGFSFVGVAKARQLEEEARNLETWLNRGYQGEMSYMANHFDKRIDPTKLVPGAKSVVTLMYNYHAEVTQTDPTAPKISQYAYGKDYHFVVKDKLKTLLQMMTDEIGAIDGRCFVDSAPVLERDWAKHSGLGWVGKNSLLINKQQGSFFFLAELIIDLELLPDAPIRDYCGTCTRCLDACPTEAIVEPYVVDGSKCISYFTIELKAALPEEMKGKFENWMFGCDICQTVCPWNRFAQQHDEPSFEPHPDLLNLTKNDWEEITEELFQTLFRKSAVKRTKYAGLKRNIDFLKFFCCIIFAFGLVLTASAQGCLSPRYQSPIFQKKNIFENVTYGSAIPYSEIGQERLQELKFDFYEPLEDTIRLRPLVLLFFGEDFQKGNKNNELVKLWCDSLVSYGFTCAAIDYRTGYNFKNIGSTERAIYRATQDARAAIRYFKEFSHTFKIDTNLIYLCGDEAGAITALNAGLLNQKYVRKKTTYGTYEERTDLNCLDCSDNPFVSHTTQVAGIINIRGSIEDVGLLKEAVSTPTLHIDNRLAPPKSEATALTLLKLQPSAKIHDEMQQLGQPSTFIDVAITEVASLSSAAYAKEIWHSAFPHIRAFLYEAIAFKSPKPTGNLVACSGRMSVYKTKLASAYCWKVEGGTIIQEKENTITVSWNYNEKQGKVSVAVTDKAGVSGMMSAPLIVELKEAPIAEFSIHQITENMIEVTDESAYGTFYTIDYGDDSSPVSGKIGGKTVHVYDYSGTFLITQALENTCGTSNNNYQVNVTKVETDSWELLKQNVAILPENPSVGMPITITVLPEMPYDEVRVKIIGENSQEVFYQRIRSGGNKATVSIPANQLSKGKYTLRIMADSNSVNKYFEVK